MKLEDNKKRYEVAIKDGKKLLFISYATKKDLIEYVTNLEKVCPKCYTQINIDMINEEKGAYFCQKCKREYLFQDEYRFVAWDEWMEDVR